MSRYTKASYDFEDLPWLTSPRQALGLTALALGLIRIPAGKGYTFTHRHAEQEEVYLAIEGRGAILIDGELLPLARGDVIRVAPEASRALKADDDSPLLIICAGAVPAGYPKDPNARYLIDDGIPDYDDLPPWYEGDEEVKARNEKLKQRMLRSKARREER